MALSYNGTHLCWCIDGEESVCVEATGKIYWMVHCPWSFGHGVLDGYFLGKIDDILACKEYKDCEDDILPIYQRQLVAHPKL